MPERPLIILPAPAVAQRDRSPGRGNSPHLPGHIRQGERLTPQFQILRDYFAQRAVELTPSASGHVPEEVIVFETVGLVSNFLQAARRVQGLDFLAEWDVEDIAPDDDFYDTQRREARLSGRLFLVMTNQQALQQLLGLWQSFRTGGQAQRGLAPFFEVFSHLRDLRRWSAKDRLLETGVVEYWREAAASGDSTPVPFEVELWFRQTEIARRDSALRLRGIIEHLRGQVVSICELEPISYHSVVVMLPASEVRRLVSGEDLELLGESAIMCFRPSGQAVIPGTIQSEVHPPVASQPNELPGGDATVALLDGLPLENHSRLAGRLRIDDPDGYANTYTAFERQHGTSMASIIVHGDLNAPGQPMPRPLYVRPILRPDPQPWNANRDERVPFGVNSIDLTHRAVRRLFEGEGTIPPTAPSVKIINFSIGDVSQQFHSAVSAWGRLLDWLSVKYNVLFCVSVGNQTGSVVLDIPRTAFGGLSAQEREKEILKALLRDLRLRRLLSPADSINSITVGAWHHDFGPIINIAARFNPYTTEPLPSPVNSLGCGFRNSTKPELLFPGGRQFFSERLGNTHANATLEVAPAIVAPGILVATPSSIPGQLDREKHVRGTSNATAFATRSGAFLYEQLVALRSTPDGDTLGNEFSAVLVKAMLAHRAFWGSAYDYLKTVLKPDTMREEKFKRLAARFLGLGFVEPTEGLVASDHRAVLIGCGQLRDNEAHEYSIPLPPSLSGVRGLRRVVVTLAWFSPIRPRHRNYRGAALWFDVEKLKLGADRRDIEWRSARNGTIQHEIFEGERAVVIAETGTMKVKVNCRADAASLTETVRYGLIVSIEVAEELRVPVYEEIATRIRPAVSVRA
jgi:hypothetical protein